jgi:hypothetical protein
MKLKAQFVFKLLTLVLFLSSCRDIDKVKTDVFKEVSLLPKINNQYSCIPDDAFYVKDNLYFYCKSTVPKDSVERTELRTSVENHLNQWVSKNVKDKTNIFVYFTDERSPLRPIK